MTFNPKVAVIVCATACALTIAAVIMDLNARRSPSLPSDRALSVTAEDLVADYDANSDAADHRYRGRTLRVFGVVLDVDASNRWLTFEGVVKQSRGAQASFDENHRYGLSDLRPGDRVVVICAVDDEGRRLPYWIPQLTACSLERP